MVSLASLRMRTSEEDDNLPDLEGEESSSKVQKTSKMDELRQEGSRLQKTRTPVRGKFTRLCNEASKLVYPGKLDKRLPWYVAELEKVLSKLETLDQSLEDIIVEIGKEEEIHNFFVEKDKRSENDSFRLYELKAFLENELKVESQPQDNLSEFTQNLSKVLETNKGPGVKLPELTLPRFNGDPLRWTEFWDLYNATIHTNQSLSNTQKLAYLRSLLEDKALEAVVGFKQVEANYLAVVETLTKRFGKPRLVKNSPIKLSCLTITP